MKTILWELCTIRSTLEICLEQNFIKTYRNPLFAGESDTINWSIAFRGILGNSSDVVTKQFSVGIPRPENDAELIIGTVKPTQVELSWTVSSLNDSVRIWWGTEPVPLDQYEMDISKFSFRSLSIMETTTNITGLTEQTDYYFGLQVNKNGLWSYVTSPSSKAARTSEVIDTNDLPNKIRITDLSFSPADNSIQVQWTVDTNGIGDLPLEAGIVWSTSTYPKNPPSSKMGNTVYMGDTAAGINVLHLELEQDLVFDTLYYFVIWLRIQDGAWSDPTDSSKSTLRIPPATWQGISYFKASDSMSMALNRTVILQKGPTWSSGVGTIFDTIDVISPASSPTGFIPVSKTINLKRDNISPALYFGMRCDFIPASFKVSDVNLYEYDILNSKWIVINRSKVDSSSSTIFCLLKPNDHKGHFVLMIDTLEPVVEITDDTSSAVLSSANIEMNTTATDNIANLSIELWAGKGADTLFPVVRKTAVSYSDAGIYTIPSDYITEDNGVRAFLIVSDGRNTRKIDVSRRVIRTASDPVASDEQSWMPVAPTAVLDNSSIEYALNELQEQDPWTYDSIQFRIFRWVSYEGNATDSKKWVEYSPVPEIQQFFNLVPGRVVWVKTRNSVTFDLGSAKTVSLKQPCEYILKANEWTDFALPFKFNIRIGDILQETGLDPLERDSIWFYSWKWNEEKKSLYSSPVFVPVIPDGNLNNPGNDLAYAYREAFTIYNNLDRDITLKVPSTPVSMSKYPTALPKKGASSGWCVALRAQTASEDLTPVYCGYTPGTGKTLLPVAPSFGNVQIYVRDEKSDRVGGHMIAHESNSDGYAFPLVFKNNSNSTQTISYCLDRGSDMPAQMKVAVYNPSTGNLETGLSMQLVAGQKEYRYLLTGDTNFVSFWTKKISSYDFSLLRLSPNPCRDNLQIRFSLPYNGIQQVHLAIYDQLGRKVWFRKMSRELVPGINSAQWNPSLKGPLASGTYILHLSAYNARGKVIGTKQSRIMYLP